MDMGRQNDKGATKTAAGWAQLYKLGPMQIYMVGGAVRDRLWAAPSMTNTTGGGGATPEQMLELGCLPVGRDFPVFLHPETREEYALARTERKSGRGYWALWWRACPTSHWKKTLPARPHYQFHS